MAVQMSAGVRNARLDQIETTAGASCSMRIYTGAQPADVTVANSGTILADFNLPADWMANAATGSKAKAGTWQDTTADNTGTPGHFRIYNSQATKDGTTCFMQGSAAVGSGDLNFDGTVTAGQTVTINTFTLTDGNA
jgi:hypothetical protein